MSGHLSQTPDERSILLHAVAEQSLTAEQEQRLADLLRNDAAFRREYVRFCELVTQLMWESSAPSEPRSPAEAIGGSAVVRPSHQSAVTSPPKTIRFRIAAAGLMGAAIMVALMWSGAFGPAASPGSLSGVVGQIEITRKGHPAVVLRSEGVAQRAWPLQRNDRIETTPGSSALLTLLDGTRIRILPSTQLTMTALVDASLTLGTGGVVAQVVRQPEGRAVCFVTPNAAVRVLGTELEILAMKERTQVAVTEGTVRVTRTADNASVEITAAQFVSVAKAGPIAVANWPRPPDNWSEHFEDRAPPGGTGRLIRGGLPSGSRGALQAVAVSDSRGRRMEASSPAVDQGLFAWHPDSVLHATFRIQPPAWLHVYLFVRTYERAEPLIAWCRIDPELWQTQPGEWRTVDIPLSEFQLAGFDRSEPALGRIPVRLAFIGPIDLEGVVIDEVRVDRGGLPVGVTSETLPESDSP